VKDLRRTLKIKFFIRTVQKAYPKNAKTFVNKSKWTAAEKSVDPKLPSCIKAFTEEVNELNLLPEKKYLLNDGHVEVLIIQHHIRLSVHVLP